MFFFFIYTFSFFGCIIKFAVLRTTENKQVIRSVLCLQMGMVASKTQCVFPSIKRSCLFSKTFPWCPPLINIPFTFSTIFVSRILMGRSFVTSPHAKAHIQSLFDVLLAACCIMSASNVKPPFTYFSK